MVKIKDADGIKSMDVDGCVQIEPVQDPNLFKPSSFQNQSDRGSQPFLYFFLGGGQSETGWSNHPWIVIHQDPSVCFHFPTMTPFYSFAVVHEKKWIKEITSIAL